ncbi:MAG TPA: hypothetical protein HPQ04_00935 [Rhodospirillaceae bacterium]|nr:hypothetical protein [Rhodospirillaceae bacterium]
MSNALLTVLAESLSDPVLRRWRLGRLFGRWPAVKEPEAQLKPFLDGLTNVAAQPPAGVLPDLPRRLPRHPARLVLAGRAIELQPTKTAAVFQMSLPASAQYALQCFSWLPRQPDLSPDWVSELWRAWVERAPRPGQGDTVWHPDTAAQRAVNLLDFARRVGLPGPRKKTLEVLGAHLRLILERLDYRLGTSAVTQGHAVYRLGLDLGEEAAAQHGMAILTTEARRLIGRSGVVLAESTGQHLRLTRCYADAWLAARRHHRPEAFRLAAFLRPMLAVVPALTLPGGLPEIGDMPGDWPADMLAGLGAGGDPATGWGRLLTAEDRAALAALGAGTGLYDLDLLRSDGWLRADFGPWSGLWHAAPQGWGGMTGQGHQDLGACELHFGGRPLFVDPGSPPPFRGDRAAELFRTAAAHGGLTIGGHDPYPPARPFYSDDFRREIAGAPPVLASEHDGVSLVFDSYRRLGGPRQCSRRWRFGDGGMVVDDRILGTGRYLVERRFVTPLTAVADATGVTLMGGGRKIRITGDAPAQVHQGCRWAADGTELPLSLVVFAARVNLPWQGRLTVAPVDDAG